MNFFRQRIVHLALNFEVFFKKQSLQYYPHQKYNFIWASTKKILSSLRLSPTYHLNDYVRIATYTLLKTNVNNFLQYQQLTHESLHQLLSRKDFNIRPHDSFRFDFNQSIELKQCDHPHLRKAYFNGHRHLWVSDRSWSLLHYACFFGDLQSVRLLIQKEWNAFERDSQGRTPSEIALLNPWTSPSVRQDILFELQLDPPSQSSSSHLYLIRSNQSKTR